MIAFNMLKSTRRKIFYTLVVLFIVLGAGIIAYADGWRLDFATWHMEKVGQIYVRSFPNDAALTVDGKAVQNQSGFISRGTLIDNLLPRTYTLTLTKPGFVPWHEEIAVAPAIVAELKYAVLVPQNATMVFMGPLIAGFPTKFGVVTQAANGTVSLDGSPLANGILLPQNDQAITASMPEIIIQSSHNGPYYAENLETGKSYNLSALFLKNNINLKTASSVVRDGYASLVVAVSPTTTAILDETAGTMAAVVHASSGVAFVSPPAIAPSGIIWAGFTQARGTSALYQYDPAADTVTHSSSSLPGQTTKIDLIRDSHFAVLQSNGDLFTYDADTQTFKSLASDVLDFSVSEDGTMLAARERASIEIFALNGTDYWRLNLPDHPRIQDLSWYRDDRHIFVAYPDHVSFLDLADQSLVNIVTIGTGILPHYDGDANALYMLDNVRNLIRFDFPN